MKRLLHFLLWPAIGGLVAALIIIWFMPAATAPVAAPATPAPPVVVMQPTAATTLAATPVMPSSGPVPTPMPSSAQRRQS